jgi:uncharacterized membrane protein YdjX (TVP38/TMEM64 family)
MNNKLVRVALLIVLAVGIAVAIVYRDQFDATALQDWVQRAGAAAPIAFMLLYALATVFFLPGSVLTLAGGALFGPILGTLLNLTGATIGATLAFLISRYLASDWVTRKTGGKLSALINGVEAEGWRFVAFVRLVPLFPFNLLNYALGLTRIKLSHYVLASYLFMFPGAIAYTYLGYAGRETLGGGEDLIQKALLALALLAVIAFIPRLVARMRRRPMIDVQDLRSRLHAGERIHMLDVRSHSDYVGEQGHVTGSRNIPLEELETRLPELNDLIEQPIAIICRTDRRSVKAAQLLSRQGFADVHVVRGGMVKWNQAEFPIER